ncbi:MAG: hypothetical protein FJX74_20370 [Armatimonadetes bacterium]|nr:hypothetical protein [Armatimonadota bacterium]
MGSLQAAVALLWLSGRCAAQPCADMPPRPAPQNCGVSALESLAYLMGRPLSGEQASAVEAALAGDTVSMLQIKTAGEAVGLSLRGARASLDDLLQGVPGPRIVHLADPAHFTVLLQADAEWAQTMDGGRLVLLPRSELERHYTGEALVLQMPDLDDAPRAQPEALCHAFGVTGVGQEVEHCFRVANGGRTPLTLQVPEPDG